MKLVYDIEDRPGVGKTILYAFQQLLAIMAATLVVPVIINHSANVQPSMSPAAALFGAGVGTLVYLLFTRFRSPVFLGSSFAFIGSMCAAFAGAVSAQAGYAGLLLGALFAGLVYVLIAVVVRFVGVGWISVLMPAVVIGPTVAIIGLSLAGNAVGDLQKTSGGGSLYLSVLCGLVTLAVTMLCSTFGRRGLRLVPFIIGILSGYALAAILTAIGFAAHQDALKIVDFQPLSDCFAPLASWSFADIRHLTFGEALKGCRTLFRCFLDLPDFTFVEAFKGFKAMDGAYLVRLVVAYVPVAFVVFAEHLADHKNLSSIIGRDLLKDPGLHNTLAGDGVGSIAGAFFGGCPNTTYGESIACVAITGNASVVTILVAGACACLVSFLSPFVAFVNTIPSCVMGGVCIALYGFIAVSGLKMIQKVDFEENRNLFVVSVILISGIGGLSLTFGKVELTNIACALILGILTNLLLTKRAGRGEPEPDACPEPTACPEALPDGARAIGADPEK